MGSGMGKRNRLFSKSAGAKELGEL
jgi:hypothetical protein